MDYYPYGKILREYVNGESEKFLITGNERDVETGFDYFNARYMDTDIGRFLQVDPLANETSSWNPYRYAFCNPVIFIDPRGLTENNHSDILADDYYYDKDGNLDYVVETDDPDRFYQADKEGNYSEIGMMQLTPEMQDSYDNTSDGLANGSLIFDAGVYENNNSNNASVLPIVLIGGISVGEAAGAAVALPLLSGYAGWQVGNNIEKFTNNVATLLVLAGIPAEILYGPRIDNYSSHTKNARPSTKTKHQKGQARKAQDRGREKADDRRRLPNKRPKNWDGPWPPK